MTCLVDTGILYALANQKDIHHEDALRWLGNAKERKERLWVPVVCLTEISYLLVRAGGNKFAARFLRTLHQSELELADVTRDDLLRAANLMETYADTPLDFVDAVIVAMAERKNIARIATFDRRHFGVVRPGHRSHFELLP